MTLEEAQQLKPGDIISGSWGKNDNRTINKCKVIGNSLHWSQGNRGDMSHSWNIAGIELVKKGSQQLFKIY